MGDARGMRGERTIAVAIDWDKESQNALKWALEHLLSRGQTVILIHVNQIPQTHPTTIVNHHRPENDQQAGDFFFPFRVYCSRRNVQWEVVTLQDHDVSKAIIDYSTQRGIDVLVLGAPRRNSITRIFWKDDVASTVLRGAPNFCTIFVISNKKVLSTKSASRRLRSASTMQRLQSEQEVLRNEIVPVDPFLRANTTGRRHDEILLSDADISLVNSERLSTDSNFLSFYGHLESELPQQKSRISSGHTKDIDQLFTTAPFLAEFNPTDEYPSPQRPSKRDLPSDQLVEEMEKKLGRLERQLKQTMDMYHSACKEALRDKEKIKELEHLRLEDERRLQQAQWSKAEALAIAKEEKEEALAIAKQVKEEALSMAEEEKAMCNAAIEAANDVQRKVKSRDKIRLLEERKALKEAEEKMKLKYSSLSQTVNRYQSLLRFIVVLFVIQFYFLLRR